MGGPRSGPIHAGQRASAQGLAFELNKIQLILVDHQLTPPDERQNHTGLPTGEHVDVA